MNKKRLREADDDDGSDEAPESKKMRLLNELAIVEFEIAQQAHKKMNDIMHRWNVKLAKILPSDADQYELVVYPSKHAAQQTAPRNVCIENWDLYMTATPCGEPQVFTGSAPELLEPETHQDKLELYNHGVVFIIAKKIKYVNRSMVKSMIQLLEKMYYTDEGKYTKEAANKIVDLQLSNFVAEAPLLHFEDAQEMINRELKIVAKQHQLEERMDMLHRMFKALIY